MRLNNDHHHEHPVLFEAIADLLTSSPECRQTILERIKREHPHESERIEEFALAHDFLNEISFPLQVMAQGDATIQHDESVSSKLPQIDGYTIERLIAEGGMGLVYRAVDNQLGRTVAIKIAKPNKRIDSSSYPALWAEASRISQLSHASIVPLYGYGSIDGQPYFTMQFMSGGNLAERLNQGSLRPRDAAAIVQIIAKAIHFAHCHGVIHRDVKPSNVMFDANDEPHIGDFGLAIATESEKPHVAGTPAYMAPEQICPGQPLTSAVDIYGLGAVLCEALTGKPPFGHSPLWQWLLDPKSGTQTVREITTSGVDRELKAICLKCLRTSPEERYSSADAVADDLQRWLDHEPVAAFRASSLQRIRKSIRRSPLLALSAFIAGTSAVATLTTAVYAYIGIRSEQQTTAQALYDRTAALEATSQAVDELVRLRNLDRLSIYAQSISLADRELLTGRADEAMRLLDACELAHRGWEWKYLHATASRRMPLSITTCEPYDAAFQPGTRQLFVATGISGVAGHVQRFNVAESSEPQPATEIDEPWIVNDVHTDAISAIAFDRLAHHIVLGDLSGRVSLWKYEITDEPSENLMPVLLANTIVAKGAVRDFCVLEEQGKYAVGIQDGTVLILDSSDLNVVNTIPGNDLGCLAIDYSSDQSLLAISRMDNHVQFYDTKEGSHVGETESHEGTISSLHFFGSGEKLVTTSHDGTIRIWNTSNGQEVYRSDRQPGPILQAGLLSDGTSLLIGGQAGSIQVWDIPSQSFLDKHFGSRRNIVKLSAEESGNGFASLADDGGLSLWKLDSPRLALPGSNALSRNDVERIVWDYVPGKCHACLLPSHSLHVTREDAGTTIIPFVDGDYPWKLSSCGTRILAAADHSLRVYDNQTGQRIARFSINPHFSTPRCLDCVGDVVVAANEDGGITVLIMASSQNEPLNITARDTVSQCEIGRDGTSIVAVTGDSKGNGSGNFRLNIWTLTGRLIAQSEVAGDRFEQLGSDKIIACYGASPDVVLMNDSLETLQTLPSAASPIVSVTSDPKCERLFLLTDRGEVHVWDWKSLRRLLVLPARGEPIEQLHFHNETLIGFNRNGFVPTWTALPFSTPGDDR